MALIEVIQDLNLRGEFDIFRTWFYMFFGNDGLAIVYFDGLKDYRTFQ